ncbi:MAG: PAS domain S-box protein [Actinomycetota bacterium]|nr:PAS domain S-box protein [Actinomycetota bacterium]
MTGIRRATRRAELPPEAASAGRARRIAGEVLVEAGLDELADVAVLLVSETVTNAVLHAATDVGLTVVADDGFLRVEVRDGSTVLPGIRHYEDEATTGRGVGLVELLATAWGVDADADAGGKTVWFTLGGAPATSDEGGGHEVDAPPVHEVAPGLTVRFLQLPVHLTKATLQHGDAVLRELALAALSGQALRGMETWEGVPLDLSHVLDPVEVALAEGAETIDLDATFPAGAEVGAARRRDLVQQAEALADAGGFLAPRPLPEVERTRWWLYAEIIGQAAGAAPAPWVEREELGRTEAWVRLSDRERVQLDGLAGPVVVADESNHIVHVDGVTAALLGWEPDDLVGRRLTTIVPPALRGAHIAGYTRYQLTRSAVIVGRAVRVPALRHDGTIVEVSLLIQPYTSADGRRGYQARLERA